MLKTFLLLFQELWLLCCCMFTVSFAFFNWTQAVFTGALGKQVSIDNYHYSLALLFYFMRILVWKNIIGNHSSRAVTANRVHFYPSRWVIADNTLLFLKLIKIKIFDKQWLEKQWLERYAYYSLPSKAGKKQEKILLVYILYVKFKTFLHVVHLSLILLCKRELEEEPLDLLKLLPDMKLLRNPNLLHQQQFDMKHPDMSL